MHVLKVVADLCRPILSLVAAAALAGCAYGGLGPPQPHYLQFNAAVPHGNTVTVCASFTFTHHDIATLTTLGLKS